MMRMGRINSNITQFIVPLMFPSWTLFYARHVNAKRYEAMIVAIVVALRCHIIFKPEACSYMLSARASDYTARKMHAQREFYSIS